jgi:diamine N-acetyltransferase
MITLKGTAVYLRALEPEDLEFVHAIENDEQMWEVSNTQTPYSRYVIRQYLENAQQDIFAARQLRLAICTSDDDKAVGLIDLFDFDPKNKRAGVGIIISESGQNRGIGSEALGLLIDYAFAHLDLHQLYANIDTGNDASLRLFAKFGFRNSGVKKDWNIVHGAYKDEALFQLINK